MALQVDAVMDGYAYLLEFIVERFRDLASFAAQVERHKINQAPVLSPVLLSKEAMICIVIGIGKGLAEEPRFDLPGIGPFIPQSIRKIELRTSKQVAETFQRGYVGPDPVLDRFLDNSYWKVWSKSHGEIGAEAIREVLAHALSARFAKGADFSLSITDSEEAGDLVLRSFFSALIRALVARTSVWIRGLGHFSYGGDPNEIVFVASDHILESVELYQLRQQPYQARHSGVYAEKRATMPVIPRELVEKEFDAEMACAEKLPNGKQEFVSALERFLRGLMSRYSS